ncbi:putative mannitol dehydrogenase [Phlyctochytrium arcticum]|nr:putative mannitol dehydrogenase [Phlyctochytrium arcticum]
MSSPEQFSGYAVHEKSGELKPWKYTPRPLGDDDVEITIDFCGICGSDLHTIDSGWYPTPYPVIVGHEIVGKIAAKGSKVGHLNVGDRVGVGALCYGCFDCKDCNRGFDNCCDKKVWTYANKFADGEVSQGGYADRVRVQSKLTFKLPEKLDSASAAPLLCAGVTTYAPLKRHGAGPGKRVGVLGIGGLGHLGLQWARALGAQVTAISHSPRKKDEALRLGAHEFLATGKGNEDAVKAAQASFDIILCTGHVPNDQWGTYLNLLDVGGKMIIVSLPEEPLAISPFSLTTKQVEVIGSSVGSRAEIEEMLAFAAEKDIKAQIEVVPLRDCQAAVERVRKGDVHYRFVLDIAKA